MADYQAAQIRIGGKIPPSLVGPLCSEIVDEQVALGFGGEPFRPSSAQDLLDARADVDGVMLLELCDDEARWGEFNDLESFLEEYGIAYTRRTGGDPEIVEFRRGAGPMVLAADTSLEPIVKATELSGVDDVLSQALGLLGDGSINAALLSVQEAQRLLREAMPPVLPPLEAFGIEQGSTPEAPHGE